jgi:hypothetical protein
VFVDVEEFDYEIQFGRITGRVLSGPGRTIVRIHDGEIDLVRRIYGNSETEEGRSFQSQNTL